MDQSKIKKQNIISYIFQEEFNIEPGHFPIGEKGNEVIKRKKYLESLPLENLENIKKILQDKKKTLPQVELPGNNRNNKDFAKDIAKEFKDKEIIFYKPNEQAIIEITEYFDKYTQKELTGFSTVTPIRLINIIENNVECIRLQYTKFETLRLKKSPSEPLAKYLSNNDDLIQALKTVNRFMNSRMPFLINNTLIIPKTGFNEEMDAFINKEAPEIVNIEFEEAKKIILELLEEFCFKEEIDRTMAIAGLLTPACRGLYSTITARTPIFLYIANRERAGKDYLAGITGILYEGQNIQDPPVADSDKNNNANAELRKKITSSLKRGQRRFHSANNKGKIDNAVLEQVTTAEYWNDRVLGSNKELTLPNELDFSLSANIGISWTPDFWNRCRPINLFLAQEDPNKRKFERPNLHEYVAKNRSLIQSAIISIIKEWYNAGMPSGETFASFPEWARVVGGITSFAGFGDPCVPLSDESAIGGDRETINFKQLFVMMNKIQTDTLEKEHTTKEITTYIKVWQAEGSDIFSYYDFEKNSDKMKFGRVFKKYVGRIFDKVKLLVSGDNVRSERIKYSFIKESGEVGDLVVSSRHPHVETEQNHKIVAKTPQKPQTPQKIFSYTELTNLGYSKTDIEIRINNGDIVEYRSGQYKFTNKGEE